MLFSFIKYTGELCQPCSVALCCLCAFHTQASYIIQPCAACALFLLCDSYTYRRATHHSALLCSSTRSNYMHVREQVCARVHIYVCGYMHTSCMCLSTHACNKMRNFFSFRRLLQTPFSDNTLASKNWRAMQGRNWARSFPRKMHHILKWQGCDAGPQLGSLASRKQNIKQGRRILFGV